MPNSIKPTIIRSLLIITLTTGLLALTGLGCNGLKSGEGAPRWTPAQQQLIDAWPTTTEGMLANLRASVEVVSKLKPDRIIVSQIAFKNDLPASEVIALFKQFPSSSFVTFYPRAGKIGGGFYNFRPETPAKEELVQVFKEQHILDVADRKRDVDYAKQECLKGDTLCDKNLSRAQEAYDAELARNGEQYIGGLDLRGPARDLGLLINDPRVFSINVESGDRPVGIPFYPEIKDVHKWTP